MFCKTCVCLQGKGQFDEDVEMAINGGCLPSEGDIKEQVKNGIFWACHDREAEKVICQGAVSYAKSINVEVPEKANLGQLFDDKYEII